MEITAAAYRRLRAGPAGSGGSHLGGRTSVVALLISNRFGRVLPGRRIGQTFVHLHRPPFFFREQPYPWQSPQADLAAAERLINDCGYHRRDEELADAKRAILGAYRGNSSQGQPRLGTGKLGR